MNKSIDQDITDKIIKQMETAGSDWLRPFSTIGGAPRNVVSNKPYQGINRLLLSLLADCHLFATYKQWQDLGGQVRKGSKGFKVVKYGTFEKEASNGDMETKAYLKGYTVFSANQVDNLPEHIQAQLAKPESNAFSNHANIDTFVANTGANISTDNSNQPCYIPSLDLICMPSSQNFSDNADGTALEHYYSTLLHELTHWTGAKNRLDRKSGKRFGDTDYSFEELVAELGSAFLCSSLGLNVEPRADHAKYLNGWLKALKNDKGLIREAAKHAQKAVTYLEELQQTQALAA